MKAWEDCDGVKLLDLLHDGVSSAGRTQQAIIASPRRGAQRREGKDSSHIRRGKAVEGRKSRLRFPLL